MKRALLAMVVVVALLAAAAAINTIRQSPPPLPHALPASEVALDLDAAVSSLSKAVQARTVSTANDAEIDEAPFIALHRHLEAQYPRIHQTLKREVVGHRALLFTWQGSDPSARPIALMAHQDVVPIGTGAEDAWSHAPFGGEVADGYVWGRGTWDNKSNLIAQFEAVELLIKSGFAPKRTIYFVLGDDEEVGGLRGARQVAAVLAQRKVQLEFVLDEGMLIAEGMLPGLSSPAALIGVSEKGMLTVTLEAKTKAGHSSMPPSPGESAIAILSEALVRVDAHPLPPRIGPVVAEMLGAIAPYMSGLNRVVLSNQWLFSPLLKSMLAKRPSSNALIRTTTALTLVHSGNKDNVLPDRAEATVNFRLLPGDSVETVLQQLAGTLEGIGVEIKSTTMPIKPSPVSSSKSAGYAAISSAITQTFGEVIVAPALMLGGTDARHFSAVADDIYRFSPIRSNAKELERFHGIDERVSVENFSEMIRFYHRLLRH